MKDIFLKYVYYLDNLRQERKLTVIDFCENICSDRAYRKYLSGTSIMSQDKLGKFCKKLGFSPAEFYHSFNIQDTEELHLVTSFYDAVGVGNYDKAKKLLVQLDTMELKNPLSIEYYNYIIIRYNYETKKITKMNAYDKYKKLINYPECLTKTHFDITDILVIRELSLFEYELKESTALNFLKELLFDRHYIFTTSHTRFYLTSVYKTVSQLLGMLGDIDESMHVANEGIKFSLLIGDSTFLHNLYYLLSLGLYSKGDKEGSKKAARKCLANCIALNRINLFKTYCTLMEKDYNEDPIKYLHIDSVDDL